ncbi:MAG TPA: HAMP domain-containing protein [Thermoflexia bacterium]|nr:HAMP domain-containing protein [Thermoflexia bacterium]
MGEIAFHTPPATWEYLLLALYAPVMIVLLVYTWRDFKKLRDWRRALLFLGLLVASRLAAFWTRSFFISGLFNLLPPPNVPDSPDAPFISLLSLPVIAAGAWLGPGPALIVGLVSGIWRAGMTTHGVTDPFHFAFFGFLAGFFLRQDYRGRPPLIARQPLLAGPLAMLLASPLLLLSVFARVAGWGLAAVDYAVNLAGANLVPALLECFVAAIVVQAAYISPRLRPVHAAYRSPPYTRTLNRRLLFLFVPLILTMTCALVYAVTATTLHVATQEVINEMARDAHRAAEDIPYFIHTGQGLLEEFANDEVLQQSDQATLLEEHLRSDLRTVAFFNQLMLFDPDGRRLAMYPQEPTGDPELTEQEKTLLQRVLETGATQISTVHRSPRDEAILSFLVPVEDEETGEYLGALLGRTQLDINPVLNRALSSLQWTRESGKGFVVDEEWRIVAHSDSNMLFTEWRIDESAPPLATVRQGQAYESPNPQDNTRELVYCLEVEGYSWRVVVRLPYDVVLEQARQVATPLLFLQALLGGGLVIVIPLVTSWLTRPLTQLASAADRIAEGDLAQPVQVAGDDEVARVGHAFEDMRVRLKDRLDDLSLLLQVSQAVSATLELPEGMPFVLEGALKATNAQAARIVFLSASGAPQMVMSRGTPQEGLGALDRALAIAGRDQERPLIVENLARAKTLAEPEVLEGPIKAVIVLPVRTKDRVPAVMWIGYGKARQFDASEVDLLSTLVSQTAVLVENARLFQAAEGGRRRLTAVLTSTSDAILVTDRDDRILLVNPAAERSFGIAAQVAVGQKVDEADLSPAMQALFEEAAPESGSLTGEVPLPDGRTLYASISTILSADGERIGRVALMRDITHFKELDEMKSEFVATVSHDLRAPLTFMRGYTTMLPMVGELSGKQSDYVEKILHGVGQMSELIDDLLNLGRIEAGIDLERQPCHLGTILVEAVDGMRARAAAKGLTLRLEPTEGSAVVAGDAALLRQVITNLVDNAIKYTPSGGVVTAGLSAHKDHCMIRIADTGIGIAPDDRVRLFEKFYRIRRRDTADIPGTGLGLAIVKSIVERHGGKVWVESELNIGSTFYASLPLGEIDARTVGRNAIPAH